MNRFLLVSRMYNFTDFDNFIIIILAALSFFPKLNNQLDWISSNLFSSNQFDN